MPRIARVVAVGLPHHVTQRGNNRRLIFDTDEDRLVYLKLLREHADHRGLVIWGLPDGQSCASDRGAAEGGCIGAHTAPGARGLCAVRQRETADQRALLAEPLFFIRARRELLLDGVGICGEKSGAGGVDE